VLAASSNQTLVAQDIHIRVMNANNGKSITDECLNIWIGQVKVESFGCADK
jgi:hypothetical protein